MFEELTAACEVPITLSQSMLVILILLALSCGAFFTEMVYSHIPES